VVPAKGGTTVFYSNGNNGLRRCAYNHFAGRLAAPNYKKSALQNHPIA
jgi:hypothetical protein